MKAVELNVDEPALSMALELEQAGARFTSGTRTREDQARAMTENVIKNRRWIVQTYSDSTASRALQSWLDAHPQIVDFDGIERGLLGVMLVLTDDEMWHLSRHFGRAAFDIEPFSCSVSVLRPIAAKYGAKMLWVEGGQIRWHAEFSHTGAFCGGVG